MFAKQMTEIKVALAPFNAASKSSRLFLNHVTTNETRQINPTLKISTNILADPQASSHIHVVYRDGKTLSLASDKVKVGNILQMVNKHAKKLEDAAQANA